MKTKQTIKLHLNKWEPIILENNDKIEVYYQNQKRMWRPTEIAEKLEKMKNWIQPNTIRIRLKPIKFKSKKLPIHPYIFGFHIADGTAKTGYQTVHYPETQNQIDIFESFGWKISSVKREANVSRIKLLSPNNVRLITVLREMGLFNKKQIPKDYIFKSMKNRILFLQGLFDGDSTVQKCGRTIFSQKRDDITKTVVFILKSLGVFSGVQTGEVYDNRTKKHYHFNKVRCLPDKFELFRLPYKVKRWREAPRTKKHKRLNNTRTIRKVEFTSQEGKDNE